MSDPGVGLFARHSPVLDRWIQIGLAGGRVIKVDILDDPPRDSDEEHPMLDRLERYVAGEAHSFIDVEIALTGPTEHRPVYETIRHVPYGTEVEVSDVLERIASLRAGEGGERIVRSAIEANPVPIIVPDHRIADVDGALPPRIRAQLREIEAID